MILEGTPGVVPPFQKTPMSLSTPDTPECPSLTLWHPQGLTQNMMAGVTALWRLETKPPISMVISTGNVTLLFQLDSRVDLHGSTQDEA